MNEDDKIQCIIKDIEADYTNCIDLLKKIRKKNNKLKKILNKKKKKRKKILNKKGITHKKEVPAKIKEFFKLDNNCLLSRIEITKKFYRYISEKNLKYDKDKRIIIPDKKLRDLFNLEENINKKLDVKDKTLLTVYTIQTYIKKCYN